MNKFTYLLLLLFCMMGGVMNAQGIIGFKKVAETKTFPADLKTGYYLIKEVNPKATGKPGGYLKAASEAVDAVVTPQGRNTDYDGSNALELWYIEVNGETFTIATANKKAAWQAPDQRQRNLVAYANKANLTRTTESVTLDNKTATPTAGSCIIQNLGKTSCVHYSDNNLGSWPDANPASVMMFEFYEVKEADLTKANTAQVTYTYRLEGATKTYTKTIEQAVGENYAAPALTEVNFVTFTQPQGTVQVGENQVTVQCTENLPFEKTTDLNSPKWFAIDMHSNKNRYMWHYEADNQNIKVAVPEDLVSISKDDAYFWCLTGNVFDGFQIYNKKAGTTKSLNTTDAKPQITEGENTTWHIVKPKSSISNAACFKADNTQYLNHQGDNTLGYYANPDEGSSCRFFKPATVAIEQAEVIANIPANAVGGYLNDENLVPAITEAEKDLYNFEKANKLVDAIKALQSNGITFEEGAYYRIVNAFTAFDVQKCMLSVSGNTNIQWGSLDLKDINNVFQLEKKSNGKYCLKNVNRGQYMQGAAGLLGQKETAADMDFAELGCAQYNIHYTNGKCHTNGHNNGKGDKGNLISWDGGQNTASAWYIVKADTVEVALNTAGDASYATTYLPFSVSNVEGATAYIGKKVNESTLHATAIEGGIPVNTGVILKGAANAEKAVLTLGEATSDVQNNANALTGTLVEKDYADGELVFGVNNENKVGFYSMTAGKKIGANKAYLEAAARAMKLVFDGDVTGIENVMGEAADANAPIYDLTGRRVMKAVKGGLYIQNGKKFIAQ